MASIVTTTAQQPLGAPHILASEAERVREQRIEEIADWYRDQLPLDELKRAGRDVSVTVDYRHRLILVASYARHAHPFLDRIPPEARMEFDESALEAIRDGLQGQGSVVIVDTSDIPGSATGRGAPERISTATIRVFDIDSEDEQGEPKIIAKPQPQLPLTLRKRLLGVPKMVNNEEQKDYVAQRFFHEFLNGCLVPGS